MFIAGLAGGTTHCTGMCGPFVFGQIAARSKSTKPDEMREWKRLTGAFLIPYHLGRMTTYALLGIIASIITSEISGVFSIKWISSGFLMIAGIIFINGGINITSHTSVLNTIIPKRLFLNSSIINSYLLGVFLGFLPCGLLYGAIAAAASTNDAALAAIVMIAFTLGTVPSLVMVGFGSFMIKKNVLVKKISSVVIVINGLVLLCIAIKLIVHEI